MRFPFDKYKYYHSGNQVIAVSTFAEKAVVAAQKHAERMKRYYNDAKVEHKEAVDELNDLLMTV